MKERILDVLEAQTGLKVEQLRDKSLGVRIAKINDTAFVVLVESTVTQGNRLLVLQQLKELTAATGLPPLLLTKYIPSAIVEEYLKHGINYIDSAGNCYIRRGSLFVCINGNKHKRLPKTKQARAFQESGIKLVFRLLQNPDDINLPYRVLAQKVGIALGSVSAIINELADLKFILKTDTKTVLKNKPELLNRWITAYNDFLRPRLLKKRMRFAVPISDLSKIVTGAFWGGEPGAALLTNYLVPEIYTIYTDLNWLELKTMALVPDDNGKVEVLSMFWQQSDEKQTVHPLLVYADLMNSGDGRNLETAKIILGNELSYIGR
ncbi:MAG: hypothetical protein LBR84_01390 [Tannerella sp.]|jgi:hypothetical protein|nr:hypothetical protein [Tannerella sp.]